MRKLSTYCTIAACHVSPRTRLCGAFRATLATFLSCVYTPCSARRKGERALECAKVYYMYGAALFSKAQEDNNVFGPVRLK